MSLVNGISSNIINNVKQAQGSVAEDVKQGEAIEEMKNPEALPVDVVEISPQAQSMLNKVVSIENEAENVLHSSGEAPVPAQGQAAAAAPVRIETNASDEDSEESASSTSLNTLSESEMLELVASGEITRAEMNGELSRRGAATE